MKIEYIDPKLLIPSEYNPREITEQEFEKLKSSIKEFGFVENATINKNNEIIGGHMRVKAAIELGIKEIPCIRVDLPKNKEKLLNLALNKISGKWDNEKLSMLITELILDEDIGLSGFEEYELSLYNNGPDISEVSEKDFEDYLNNTKDIFLLKVFTTKEVGNKIQEIIDTNKLEGEDNGSVLLRLISSCKPNQNKKFE
jgi:hypothetical protein